MVHTVIEFLTIQGRPHNHILRNSYNRTFNYNTKYQYCDALCDAFYSILLIIVNTYFYDFKYEKKHSTAFFFLNIDTTQGIYFSSCYNCTIKLVVSIIQVHRDSQQKDN